MKDRVLATMPFDKGNPYVKSFSRIVEETDPHLTIEQLKELRSSRPVIGRVMSDFYGYKKVLEMGRFEGLNADNYADIEWIWLELANTNTGYGLSLGTDDKELQIFQDKHAEPVTNIALLRAQKKRKHAGSNIDDYRYDEGAKTVWVAIDKPFLKDTAKLLSPPSRDMFSYLFENLDE